VDAIMDEINAILDRYGGSLLRMRSHPVRPFPVRGAIRSSEISHQLTTARDGRMHAWRSRHWTHTRIAVDPHFPTSYRLWRRFSDGYCRRNSTGAARGPPQITSFRLRRQHASARGSAREAIFGAHEAELSGGPSRLRGWPRWCGPHPVAALSNAFEKRGGLCRKLPPL
jgi:hypothetical protein